MSVVNVNPSTYFGGTWEAWGSGRVPVGVNTNDTDFDTVEETGGAKTVTLTGAQSGVPAHSHGLNEHTHSIPQLSGTAASKKVGMRWSANYHNDMDMNATFAGSAIFTGQNSSSGGGNANYSISASDHTHSVTTNASTTGKASGSTANNSASNASQAHNNLQPYITCYMWKRTA